MQNVNWIELEFFPLYLSTISIRRWQSSVGQSSSCGFKDPLQLWQFLNIFDLHSVNFLLTLLISNVHPCEFSPWQCIYFLKNSCILLLYLYQCSCTIHQKHQPWCMDSMIYLIVGQSLVPLNPQPDARICSEKGMCHFQLLVHEMYRQSNSHILLFRMFLLCWEKIVPQRTIGRNVLTPFHYEHCQPLLVPWVELGTWIKTLHDELVDLKGDPCILFCFPWDCGAIKGNSLWP